MQGARGPRGRARPALRTSAAGVQSRCVRPRTVTGRLILVSSHWRWPWGVVRRPGRRRRSSRITSRAHVGWPSRPMAPSTPPWSGTAAGGATSRAASARPAGWCAWAAAAPCIRSHPACCRCEVGPTGSSRSAPISSPCFPTAGSPRPSPPSSTASEAGRRRPCRAGSAPRSGTSSCVRPGSRKQIGPDVAAVEYRFDPDGEGEVSNPFGIAAIGDALYVSDSAANDLLEVRAGAVGLLATFPHTGADAQSVPDALTAGADGALYVGEYTGGSQQRGTARIWRVVPGRAADRLRDRPDVGHRARVRARSQPVRRGVRSRRHRADRSRRRANHRRAAPALPGRPRRGA